MLASVATIYHNSICYQLIIKNDLAISPIKSNHAHTKLEGVLLIIIQRHLNHSLATFIPQCQPINTNVSTCICPKKHIKVKNPVDTFPNTKQGCDAGIDVIKKCSKIKGLRVPSILRLNML